MSIIVDPLLIRQWHPTLNIGLSLDQSIPQKTKLWWKCDNEGHAWQASLDQRLRLKSGCPHCYSIKRKSFNPVKRGIDDLATKAPIWLREWHPTKNDPLTPRDLTERSEKKVWWLGFTCGHEWDTSPSYRARGQGCPFCAGRRLLVGFNDFASCYSEAAKEWHPTKNGDLLPTMVLKNAKARRWWICSKGHEWSSNPDTRSKAGCNRCTSSVSKEETALYKLLKQEFEAIQQDISVKLLSRRKRLDMLLVHERYSIAIEYDGLYWHSSSNAINRDIVKSKELLEMGYFLIRVRNRGLPALGINNSSYTEVEGDSKKDLATLSKTVSRQIKKFQASV